MALIGEHLTDSSSNEVVSGTRAREKLVDKDGANPLVKFISVEVTGTESRDLGPRSSLERDSVVAWTTTSMRESAT